MERKEKCFLKKASVSIAIAKNKIRIILTRNVLHLHEDFKADLKDTKGNLNKQKDTMGWLGRFLMLKMSVFFIQIHKFNVTSIKIFTGFLMDNITSRSN